MKISEFFLKQTKAEIRECCKTVGLEKYYNVPNTVEQWCEMFNLEQDDVIKYFYVIKRHSNAEVYVHFELPNPVYPDCPIVFESEFGFQTAKKACKVALYRKMSFNEYVNIYKTKMDIFDARSEFSEVEYDVRLSYLTDVSMPYKEYDFSKVVYILKDESVTLWDVYQSVCNFTKDISPLLDIVLTNFRQGGFEDVWNQLEPKNKWNRGHEQFRKMTWTLVLTGWYRVVKAGVKPAFRDFVKLFASSTIHNKEFGQFFTPDFYKLTDFNGSDEEAKEAFYKIISIY